MKKTPDSEDLQSLLCPKVANWLILVSFTCLKEEKIVWVKSNDDNYFMLDSSVAFLNSFPISVVVA